MCARRRDTSSTLVHKSHIYSNCSSSSYSLPMSACIMASSSPPAVVTLLWPTPTIALPPMCSRHPAPHLSRSPPGTVTTHNFSPAPRCQCPSRHAQGPPAARATRDPAPLPCLAAPRSSAARASRRTVSVWLYCGDVSGNQSKKRNRLFSSLFLWLDSPIYLIWQRCMLPNTQRQWG